MRRMFKNFIVGAFIYRAAMPMGYIVSALLICAKFGGAEVPWWAIPIPALIGLCMPLLGWLAVLFWMAVIIIGICEGMGMTTYF